MRSKRLIGLTGTLAALAAVGAMAAFGSGGKVSVSEKEWQVLPAPKTATPGKVTFTVRNKGKLSHEFIVVKTNLAPGKLPVKGTKVNLAKLKVEGKIAAFKPGQTKTLTVTLPKGKYVLFCNLPAHYKAGQFTGFTVK